MRNLWEKAKAHPTITALVVFGVGLLFVVLLFGGNKSGGSVVVAPVAQATDTSAATALQMANINAGVQTQATAAALQAALAGTAAQVTDSNNNASVNLANIYATADTTKYVADLGAKVALDTNANAKSINDANVSGAVQIAGIQSLADQNIAQLTADASTKIADLNYRATSQNIAAGVTIAGLQQQLGVIQSNNAVTMNAQNNNSAQAIAGMTLNSQIQMNRDKLGTITHAIDVSSADQWGGGFVNPGIAAFLAASGGR